MWSSPWAVCAAAESLWTHSGEGHQSQPSTINFHLSACRCYLSKDHTSQTSTWLSPLQLEITHHSLYEVQVLGHHVVEVVCDENSPHKQLWQKGRDSLRNRVEGIPECQSISTIESLQMDTEYRDIPWCSHSSWSRTRQTSHGELKWAQTGWTWR